MALIDFNQVASPDVMQSLGSIIFAESVRRGLVHDHMEVVPAQSGQRIPVLYPLSKIGKPSRKCSPEIDEANAKLTEKKWLLEEWDFKLKMCYADFEKALYNLGLNVDDQRPDMTGTPLMEVILRLVEPAVEEMTMRFAWFGDKNAKNVTDGGSIADGVDTDFFTLVDGVWKQIAAMITAGNGIKYTAIAANQAASTEAQMEAAGMDAVAILSKVINEAPIALRSIETARKEVIVTDAFMAKLKTQLLAQSIATESQFSMRENGIQELKLFGLNIESQPYWDKEIAESFNNGTKLDNPYRVLYTAKDNLLFGIPQKVNENGQPVPTDNFEEFNSWYNRDDRHMYIEGMGMFDVKVVRPELISVAY